MRNPLNRNRDERGAAVVEFAIAIPIFLALIALIFDAGLGFAASRESSSTARSAARVGAIAGDIRLADYQILDAVRAKFGDGANVKQITVYLSEPGSNGAVPPSCVIDPVTFVPATSQPGLCNVYPGSFLAGLNPGQFGSQLDAFGQTIIDPITDRPVCSSGAPDAAWCPTRRRVDNEGKYLGVAIWTTHDATVELYKSNFDIEDRAVFSFYFPPVASTPGP